MLKIEGDKLYINDKEYIPKLNTNYETFLNKSITLYGSSNSGKSTIMLSIMKILKPVIPVCIVFNSTENSNNTFKKYVPECCIYTSIDLNKLEDIWKRQETISNIYNYVNDIDYIKNLINIFNYPLETHLTKIESQRGIEIEKLLDKNYDKNIYNKEKEKINNKFNELEKILYKTIVKNIKKQIQNDENGYKSIYKSLNEEQKIIIKHHNINPNLLLIMDDMASEIRPHTKNPKVSDLFYKARHCNMTIIFSAQDEISLHASLRKNVRISIFTDENCALGFFTRASNGFNDNIKKKIKNIITVLFNNENKYKKLIYNKDDKEPIQWYQADIIEPFSFCDSSITEYTDKLIPNEKVNILKLIKKI
jgi:energy-coupling factor transporter ATP-binding protein EcfA2